MLMCLCLPCTVPLLCSWAWRVGMVDAAVCGVIGVGKAQEPWGRSRASSREPCGRCSPSPCSCQGSVFRPSKWNIWVFIKNFCKMWRNPPIDTYFTYLYPTFWPKGWSIQKILRHQKSTRRAGCTLGTPCSLVSCSQVQCTHQNHFFPDLQQLLLALVL